MEFIVKLLLCLVGSFVLYAALRAIGPVGYVFGTWGGMPWSVALIVTFGAFFFSAKTVKLFS